MFTFPCAACALGCMGIVGVVSYSVLDDFLYDACSKLADFILHEAVLTLSQVAFMGAWVHNEVSGGFECLNRSPCCGDYSRDLRGMKCRQAAYIGFGLVDLVVMWGYSIYGITLLNSNDDSCDDVDRGFYNTALAFIICLWLVVLPGILGLLYGVYLIGLTATDTLMKRRRLKQAEIAKIARECREGKWRPSQVTAPLNAALGLHDLTPLVQCYLSSGDAKVGVNSGFSGYLLPNLERQRSEQLLALVPEDDS